MSNLVKAILIINAKKGWSDAARKKAAAARKAKAKKTQLEVVTKFPHDSGTNHLMFTDLGNKSYYVKVGNSRDGVTDKQKFSNEIAERLEKQLGIKLQWTRDGVSSAFIQGAGPLPESWIQAGVVRNAKKAGKKGWSDKARKSAAAKRTRKASKKKVEVKETTVPVAPLPPVDKRPFLMGHAEMEALKQKMKQQRRDNPFPFFS